MPIEPIASSPFVRHRREQDPQILVRVAERLLAPQHGRVIGRRQVRRRRGRSSMSTEVLVAATRRTGCSARELALDLLVGDDAALRGVDEEHLARVQPLLEHDVLGGMSSTPTSDAMTTRSSFVT